MAGATLDHDERLEHRTREIGRELFSRSQALAPSVLNVHWWDEHLMQWTMGTAELKGRLFRLVDVLPALPDREAILEHLKEYLGQVGELMPLVPPLLGSARSVRGRLSAAAFVRGVRRLARRFIAGATAAEAIDAILKLRNKRLAFTLDVLGEKVLSEREADDYAQRYLELIEPLTAAARDWAADPLIDTATGGADRAGGPADSPARPIPRVNLSVKPSSLYSQFDPLATERSCEAVIGRLTPILRAARRAGAQVHLDMEDYALRDLTLGLFERVAGDDEWADWRDFGIAIQAYLTDSAGDLERVIALARRRGTPLTVRLVKGAYWDYENVMAVRRNWPVPVFPEKRQTDANFERLARRLLEVSAGVDGLRGSGEGSLDPVIASHNIRSLAASLAAAERLGLPAGRVEFQMLFGMGEPIQAALVQRGCRVRVYAPFGELLAGMAYLIRRLLENTSNESFLRQGFVEHAGADKLLEDPAEVPPSLPGTGTGEGQPYDHRATPMLAPGVQPSPRPSPFQGEGEFANAADTDFSKEAARVDTRQAIERFKSERLGADYWPIINGCREDAQEVLERENPADPRQIVGRIHLAGCAEADLAVQAAAKAQADWGRRPANQRAELLDKLADELEARRAELTAVEIIETAKQWREADADVSEAVDYCRFYGRQAVEFETHPRRRDIPGEQNRYRYIPRGVGAIIGPWNFPLAILAGMSAAAVAAGNTVVLKPAKQSSVVAAMFMERIMAAGFPPGVFNYLPGRGELVGDYLVKHAGVDFVAFTGSWQVGREIYAAAAANPGRNGLKHVVAEMGGKNAIIIDSDADLDEAVRGVIVSAFGYNGQKCSACSRAIVIGAIHDRFLERLVDAAASLTTGSPEDPANFLGPLIDRQAVEKVRRYIEIGRCEARCVLEKNEHPSFPSAQGVPDEEVMSGPKREKSGMSPFPGGYYVGPVIFADVPPTARIAQEEIFGPVLAVLRADSLEGALQIANNAPFALTGGLYSRSPAHIERAKREFRVGNLYINRPITGALVDRQPFGGFKCSGLGSKAGGPDYLLQFLLPQTLTENTLRHGFAESPGPSA